MNVEFHYYIVNFLALRAGFSHDDARVIAYSSEFVDSSIFAYVVKYESRIYKIEITQNYGWWDDRTPANIYIPFHFFPGDTNHAGAMRTDGRRSTLNCTPNSSRVKAQLITALKTRDLYRIGVALHPFADSWAHQNFSGVQDGWNMVDSKSLIPSIGHAQALTTPDDFAAVWADSRLTGANSRISNRNRFLEAAEKIYKYLCTYNRRSFNDAGLVMDELEQISVDDRPGLEPKRRQERILDLIIAADLQRYNRKDWLSEALYLDQNPEDEELFTGYSKLLWLRDTALYQTSLLKKKPLHAKPRFEASHLFKWCEAVKSHRLTAREILGRDASGL